MPLPSIIPSIFPKASPSNTALPLIRIENAGDLKIHDFDVVEPTEVAR